MCVCVYVRVPILPLSRMIPNRSRNNLRFVSRWLVARSNFFSLKILDTKDAEDRLEKTQNDRADKIGPLSKLDYLALLPPS